MALMGANSGGVKATAPAQKTATTQATPLQAPTPASAPYVNPDTPYAMSNAMYQGSLAPGNLPGFEQYLTDWANTGGGRGVYNQAGTGMMSYSDVLADMKARGIDVSRLPTSALWPAAQNPFDQLLSQYQNIYKDTSGTVGNVYQKLGQELQGNRNTFNQETSGLAQQIASQYGAANQAVQGNAANLENQLAALARGIGLPSSLAGESNQNFLSTMAEIAALNKVNQAASGANLNLRRTTIGDLLLGNQSAAAQQGAAAQAGLANLALNRFGMTDPGALLSKYLTDLAGIQTQNAQFNLTQLQNAIKAAGGSGGGGGKGGRGGRGRKGSGGSATSGNPLSGSDIVGDPNSDYNFMRAIFANNVAQGQADPMEGVYKFLRDAGYVQPSSYASDLASNTITPRPRVTRGVMQAQ